MRVFAMISMTVGLALMTVPIVLPRLGGIEGLMQSAGLEPAPVRAGGDGMLAGAMAAVAGAVKAFAGGGMTGDGQMVSATGADRKPLPASDMAGKLRVACKLLALRGGQSEGDCLARLGPLAQPDGMQGLMDEAARAMDATNARAGLAVSAPAGIAPRVLASSGREARQAGGGAKFVKVGE